MACPCPGSCRWGSGVVSPVPVESTGLQGAPLKACYTQRLCFVGSEKQGGWHRPHLMVVMCSHLALFSPDQSHADGFIPVTFSCIEVRRYNTDSLLFSDLAFSSSAYSRVQSCFLQRSPLGCARAL